MPKTISEEELLKSLETLEELVKGGTEDVDNLVKGKKKDDDDDDHRDDDDERRDDDDDHRDDDDDDDAEKSFASVAAGNSEEIRKAIEVSDFLGALVTEIGNAFDGLRSDVMSRIVRIEKSMAASLTLQKAQVEDFTLAIDEIKSDLQKSIGSSEELQKSLADMGTQPAYRRRSASSVNVVEKSFAGNMGVSKQTLTKSQVSNQLFQWASKNENGVTFDDVLKYESSGELRKSLSDLFG